jgi:DNA-binding transcriptional LysR family regulator
MVTLRQLSHALALQQHGNFGKAATACSISQSAFSRSIQSLEDSLGAVLFDRLHNRVEPSVFGKSVLPRAALIGIEVDEIEREINQLKGLETGHLKVVMGSNAAEISGNKAVSKLIAEYPGLDIGVSVTGWQDAVEGVLNRNSDIGLAEISSIVDDDRFDLEPVGRHPVFFVCRREHPLGEREKLAVKDLAGYRLVMIRAPERATLPLSDLGKVSPETGQWVPPVEVDNYSSICEIVRYSDAITFAARQQVEQWPDSADFHLMPIRAPWLHLDYGFISLHSRTLSPAAIRFKELVREIESDLMPGR